MNSDDPEIGDVIEDALAKNMVELHTVMPARVERYDSTKQLVDVQPLLKHAYRDESGERVVNRLPVIQNVPVAFPGGAGLFSITWPLKKGDLVMLHFAEGSLDLWKQRGNEVDPGDDRRFNLTDAIAYPGLHDFSRPIPSAGVHGTAMVIRGPLIHAGGDKALVTKEEFESHTHGPGTMVAGGDPVTGTSGTASSITGTTVLKGA